MTGAKAVITKLIGETTDLSWLPSSLLSVQLARIDSESLPTGIAIPNAGHSSDNYYSFTIVNAIQIVQIRKTDYNKFCKLAEADILGIDDIGTEPAEVQDYGNFIYPIKELLAMRYDAQLFTVFTTNLEPKEIRQRYGDRIADRLNEMMTKVVYRNLTYRTENAQMADSQG